MAQLRQFSLIVHQWDVRPDNLRWRLQRSLWRAGDRLSASALLADGELLRPVGGDTPLMSATAYLDAVLEQITHQIAQGEAEHYDHP